MYLPNKTVPHLFETLFVKMDVSSLERCKLWSVVLRHQDVKLLLRNCGQLQTLQLPESRILQPLSIIEIIKELPKLEYFE